LSNDITIGKLSVLLALSSESEEKEFYDKGEKLGYKLFKGRAGSMDGEKIFATT
jgi:hut operon positive regulator